MLQCDLAWMQYRKLYRILVTNYLLFKIKRHYDGKCNLCKQYTESVLHLFVQWENVRKFWSKLKTHIHLILGYEPTIKPCTIILLNITTNINTTPVYNIIIYLSAKLYIFRTSKSNENLNCVNICSFTKRNISICCQLELEHSNFTKTWGNFIQIFAS